MKRLMLLTIILGFIFGYGDKINAKTKTTLSPNEYNKKLLKDIGIRVYGPEEVNKTFGIPLSKIKVPKIPWTRKELEKAQKEKRVLILRTCPNPYNTVATMAKRHKNKVEIAKKIFADNYNISACALRKGWIISDSTPREWTTNCKRYGKNFKIYFGCTYEEQLTKAIKRKSYSKLISESLYDALLMFNDYEKNIEKNINNYFFVSRLASSISCTIKIKRNNKTETEKNFCEIGMVIDAKKKKIGFGALNPYLFSPTLYMLTQSIKNGL